MRKRILTAAMAALAVGPAVQAAEFDTNAHCKQVANFAGGSYAIEESCRQQEASARRSVEGRKTEPRIMKHCTEVGKFAGGSYAIVDSCIDQEEQARGRMK